jgi:AcrR family transcriptional regulator
VREAVLEATYRILLEDGYERLSIGAVAAASGVHETSIYRRWGSKAALAMDACLAMAAEAIPTPDAGSLKKDLVQLLTRVAALLQSPQGKALGAAIMAAQQQPELRDFGREFWTRRFSLAQAIFDRAAARGEIDAGPDGRFLLEMLVGPLYFRLLVSGEPLSAGFARRTVDFFLKGLGVDS